MTAPLVFLDTETTGLSLDDDIWEFAAVRRESNDTEFRLHLFLQHDSEKCNRLPEPFLADHQRRWEQSSVVVRVQTAYAAKAIHDFLANDGNGGVGPKPHIVGAVPNFDTERLALLLRRHGYEPHWHYHLIDVENLAVGYLNGLADARNHDQPNVFTAQRGAFPEIPLPWDSNLLSLAVGVDPGRFERHTAMGDVRWARAIYDAVTRGAS